MQNIFKKLNVWSGKLFRMGLRALFGFDRWHLFTLTEREYAKDIIVYCNQKTTRTAFAEIGCGLGDIIRNVRYQKRYGYDSDQKVLKASGFFNKITFGGKIEFATFSFPESALQGKFDVLVMVNWIHHISPEVLRSKIHEYYADNINTGGIIIIDTVQDKEYKFNHDIGYLTADLGSTIHKLGDYERQRQIWSINKM